MGMFEVFRNGVNTKLLFFTEEQAQSWINRQTDGAEYTIQPFKFPSKG